VVAFVGLYGLLFVLFFSSIIALLVHLSMNLLHYKRPTVLDDVSEEQMQKLMPYGPFMAMAGFVYIFVGRQFLEMYLGLF
jgi:prepilin signal peptidase PulO-like enzyme (type II secretory pathway)